MSRFGVGMNGLTPIVSVWDEDKYDLFLPQNNWSWDGRHPTVCRNLGAAWVGFWTPPALTFAFNSQSANLPVSGAWAPWSPGESGYCRLAYFQGTCRDANGATVSGAVVIAFRTSDNMEAGSATSNSDGTYSVGTPFLGVAHYILAYLDTATDLTGSTVNTLVPTIP